MVGKSCSHLGRKTSAKGPNLQKFNCCAYKNFQTLTTGPDCPKKAPGISLTYVKNSRGTQRGNSSRLVCMQGLLNGQKQPDALRGSRDDSERENNGPGTPRLGRTASLAAAYPHKMWPVLKNSLRDLHLLLSQKVSGSQIENGPPRYVNTPGEISRSRILK